MKKILIANRGEIALRIMKTCKQMEISSVAIYSDADENSPFVSYADEAVNIGPPPSNKSYLLQDKIIDVAKELNVDGIHPGYGFLSENSEFAKKVIDAGIIFIGPSAESMNLMGDKLSAKKTVSKYDIPMVPGTDYAITDIEEAKHIASNIGFPILIKASAGGGGKGMRIIEKEEDFEPQMKRAVSEAEKAFGNGAVFIEKYVNSPRHIEIQIVADTHGNVVHLFERECSIQRRHQKVIEEAPSSILTEKLRTKMGKDACQVAISCNYFGVGTVEFLYDNGEYYFLEMNTRLQVEHPVTEMITSVDLVKEQISIAEGKELSFKQSDLKIKGHSIEVRVYAENPLTGFLPDIGKLNVYNIPKGEGVRVDDGFCEGMDIPVYYDPMISKLIVHAENRNEAILKMTKAIKEYDIVGVETTLDFCRFVINHRMFKSGDFNTHFIADYYNEYEEEIKDEITDEVAISAIYLLNNKEKTNNYLPKQPSQWAINRK